MKRQLFFVSRPPVANQLDSAWNPHSWAPELTSKDFEVVNVSVSTYDTKLSTWTLRYKADQLSAILNLFDQNLVRSGATFFFADAAFPGIESLRLVAHAAKIPIKMVGYLHGGSYTTDTLEEDAGRFLKHTEIARIHTLDVVYVASEYHRRVLVRSRLCEESTLTVAKVRVVGYPIESNGYPSFKSKQPDRKPIVCHITSGTAGERPELAFEVAKRLLDKGPTAYFSWIETSPYCTPRALRNDILHTVCQAPWANRFRLRASPEYAHKDLETGSVILSTAREANFNREVAEGLLYGLQPVMCQALSNVEILDPVDHASNFYLPEWSLDEFLVDSIVERCEYKLQNWVALHPKQFPYVTRCLTTRQHIIQELSKP